MKFFLFFGLLFTILFSCQRNHQQLAYLTNRDGNFDIYLSDKKGKIQQSLTDNPGWDWYPKWSPARKGILYNSNDEAGNFSIRLMNLEGEAMPLETYGLEEFILSPDGKNVLYTQQDSQFKYIYLLEVASQSRTPLVTEKAYNGRAMWSPDNQSFSFISDRDGSNEVYLFGLNTGKSTRLTNNNLREKYISWKEDGSALLFTGQKEGEEWNNIYQLEVSTRAVTPVTDDELLYEEICWSADGRHIAFHGQWEGGHHIYVLTLKGNKLIRITSVEAYHGEPEWVGPAQ